MSDQVTICGAFGGVNMGDEAIAKTMWVQISKAYPNSKINLICMVNRSTLNSRNYSETMPTAIARDEYSKIYQALRNGPLIIGGGQMLNGGSKPKGLILLWIFTLISKVNSQPIALVGVGGRNLTINRLSRWLVRGIARRAIMVRVRDAQTQHAMTECRVPLSRIKVTADVVFSGVIDDQVPETVERNKICFAIHHSPHVSHSDASSYAKMMHRIIETYPQSKPIIVCHDNRQNYDVEFARTVSEEFGQPCEIFIPRDLISVINMYAQAQLVVSSRMHPLIIGLISGAKALPLEGSEKVADLFQSYYKTTPAQIMNGGTPYPTVAGTPDNLRASSMSNFSEIDLLVRGKN